MGNTGADFVSFDPRLPETMRLYVERLERNDEEIGILEFEVRTFLKEIDATVEELTRLYGLPPAMAA